MKKVLLSMLLSAMLCVVAAPAAEAKAAEAQTGSFQLEVEEPVIEASYSEMKKMPTSEVNAATTVFSNKAFVVGENAYVYVQFSRADYNSYSVRLFDENGVDVTKSTISSSSGDTVSVRIGVDAFTGSKNFTFVAYTNNGTEYEYITVKKGTATVSAWQGGLSTSSVSTFTTSTSIYTNVSFPAEVDAKTAEIYLYDGDVVAGYIEKNENDYSTSSYLYVNSLLPEIKNAPSIYLSGDDKVNSCSGYIYFARKLQANKYYSVKAIAGGKVYDLGQIYANGNSYVDYTYSTSSYAGLRPVVYARAYGYKMSDLVVEIVDSKTKAVLATSVGEAIFQTSDIYANYVLKTDKTLDELKGNKLVVSCGGQTIYTNSYYTGPYIADAYYNHVDNVVVVKTYGMPDGTVINVKTGKYEAKGTVANSMVILQFTKDGVATKLPAGSYSFDYTYTINEQNYNNNYSLSVMGKEEEEVSATSVSRISNRYFDATKPLVFDITLSPNKVKNETGDFYAKLILDGKQVGEKIPLTVGTTTVSDTLCWKLSANVPAVSCGNYTVSVYRGTGEDAYVYGTSLYVMDPTKVYAKHYTMSWTNGSRGIELYMPQSMEGYDKSLFGIIVTDILGNNIGVTAAEQNISSKNYKAYKFENVPADVMTVKVSFTYNGQPVYDINNIADNALLAPRVAAQGTNSYSASRTTMTDEATGYTLTTAYNPKKDSYVYIVESGTYNWIKTWELAEGRTYFTKDMLEGLKYDDASTTYDFYFQAKDGSGYDTFQGVYLGLKKEATIVANGIGTNANGNYVLYIDSQLATNYYGLYYWAERNQYVAVVGGYVDFSYDGLIEMNGTWWYVNNGVVDFSYTGLTNANGGWWMVVGGAVDFNYNGLVAYDGAWWMVQNGSINFGYTGLAANEFGWWMVVGGAIDFNYNGLVANELGWWMVQNGAINFGYTGLAANEFGWWAVVGGAIDFGYNGLMANEFGWWYVQNGTINFGYTGLAQNEAGWWYVENGAINFGYTGTAMGPDGNPYNVVNGAVVF